MTHSIETSSTITKQSAATSVSPLEQSGSNKNEISQEQKQGFSDRGLGMIDQLREFYGWGKYKKTNDYYSLKYVCSVNGCHELNCI